MPSPVSALLCPRPGLSTATRRPPLAVYGKAPEPRGRLSRGRSPSGARPKPQLGRALARHSPGPFAFLPEATEPSDPTQPTGPVVLLYSARITGPAPALLPGRRLPQPRARVDLLALLGAIQQALPASPVPAVVAQLSRQTLIWQQDGYTESD